MTRPTRFTSALEVVQTIRNGAACAVLVEGEEQGSDAWILRYILKEVISQEITFHGRDGRANLLAELPEFASRLPNGKVAAVLDRDFTDEETVELTYAPDYSGHIFYWRRYCIENYLLEPAWIAEVVETFYMHQSDKVPETLRSVETIEKFLLDWSQRLAPQVAGNWTIWVLNSEVRRHNLPVKVEPFDDLFERNPDWVLEKLVQFYGGWGGALPELFSPEAIQSRFNDTLNIVSAKIQALTSLQQVVSGKILVNAVHKELPAPKPTKDQIRNRLMQNASKQAPEDIRTLIIDRILPRWRQARSLAQS